MKDNNREKLNQKKRWKDKDLTLYRTEEGLRIRPSAYLSLMRNRDFLKLWLGQMISAIGDWVIVAVLFAFVDRLSGGKSSAISVMMLARFLPAIFLGFFAGVIIDRFDRKATLITCDLIRAGLVILLPFSNSLLMICLIVFLIETLTIIYGPAKDASIPDLVESEQLMNANSLNSVTLFASMAFGTAIAGAIIGFLTWLGRVNPNFVGRYFEPNRSAFFIDSLTFFTSAYLIYRIGFKRRGPEEMTKISFQQIKTDILEGIRYMLKDPLTRIVLILTVACFLGGGTVYVLAIGFVKYVQGGSDATFMYILTTLLFGLMAGSLLAGVLKHFMHKERWLGRSIFSFGFCLVIFSLLALRWLSFIVVFLAGVSMGYGVVGMVTLLHESLEEDFRGRVFATVQVLMRTSIFVSIIIAGPLADAINFLGKRWNRSPIDLRIIRIGGINDFSYFPNGPQTILFFGGLVILVAGMYAHRRFRHLYGEGMGRIEEIPSRNEELEPVLAPELDNPGEEGKDGI
jgi:dTMP kinase